MKQLRNFRKNDDEKSSERDNFQGGVNENQINEAFKKFGGMNEDSLIEQLLMSIKTSKENGTYSKEKMNGYVQTLRPLLDAKQYEKLINIMQIIENENV